MRKILIIKRIYRDHNDDLGDFVSKASEADSSWSEVSDEEYNQISKLIKENNDYGGWHIVYFCQEHSEIRNIKIKS